MGQYHRHGAESTAAVAGHPLHHMLVAFPIAFLIGAFATDLAFWATGNPFWARGSYWLLWAGLVTTVVAAIPGLIDFLTVDRVRNVWVSWTHLIGNGVVAVIAAVNLWLRWSDPAAGLLGGGLWLSLVTTLLLLFSGWLGGELAYRYQIGAIPDESPEVEQFHVEIERTDTAERPASRTGSR